MTSLDQLIRSSDPNAVPSGIADMLPMPEDHMPDDFFDSEPVSDFDTQTEEVDFQRNLAEEIDDITLDSLAIEILEKIDIDKRARQPHLDLIERIRDQISSGNDPAFEAPFEGASDVIYPIIVEAMLQFQARAFPAVFPVNPAKGVVLGVSDEMLDEKADRIADTVNYQVEWEDKGNRTDFEQMLWWLALNGSMFRHGRHDPIYNMNKLRSVSVEDFIVPYKTTSLMDAPHFSHRFFDSPNVIRKLMRMGFYRQVDIGDYGTSDEENNPVQQIKDDADGMQDAGESATKLVTDECFYVYIDLELAGFEDVDASGNIIKLKDGEESSGIELPYIVTIHVPSKKILAIRFNWKQYDKLQLKRIYYAHYKFLTGPGFYGWGLPHVVGTLQDAATGIVRAIGDGLGFALFKGGWKLKDAKMAGENVFRQGEFLDVDSTIDDINKAIKVAEFAPPPAEAFSYLNALDQKAKSMASTQDVMTGDTSPQNSPVGSTLALIEQASKVQTAQHGSLVRSLSDEFEIMVGLNYDFLPESAVFKMPGKVIKAQRSDFDGAVVVQPTADPAVASFQQRMATTQAVTQVSQMPQYAPFFRNNHYDLLRRTLTDMNTPAVDEVIITPEEYQQQAQQQAQQPPPPNPDVIKANAAMTVAQAKAQEIQMNAQSAQASAAKDQADAQQAAQQAASDAQQQHIDNANKKTELQLQEKAMDMNNASQNKMIDARFIGTVSPALMQASDTLATQQDTKELTNGATGATITPPTLTPQQQQLHDAAIAAAKSHIASMGQSHPQQTPMPNGQNIQPPSPQMNAAMVQGAQNGLGQQQQQAMAAQADNKGLLMRLMNKVRGQ